MFSALCPVYHGLAVSQRAVLIVNPVAGGLRSLEGVREAARWLEGQGWQVDWQATEGPGHAIVLARRAAAAGLAVAVACGGDGTIGEVADGLAHSETALAVIPGGTADVWAREVRIPRDPLKAARLVVEGERRRMDLGLAQGSGLPPEGRHFLLMAGVGLDALVVRRVQHDVKRRLGAAAYILHGAREVLGYRGTGVEVSMDGHRRSLRLGWMVVGNTRSYGGLVCVTHRARADDGLLDVLIFSGHGLLKVVMYGLAILLRRPAWAPGARYERAAAVEVTGATVPVQADGEYIGETPMSFRVVPGALRVVLPAGLRTPLFPRR